MDIREAVEELTEQFSDRPDLRTLRAVRRRVDNPAFASAIREYYNRRHNDPSVRIEFKDSLQRLLRLVQDHKADLDYDATQVGAIGIGGGIGLVGGGVVAAASAAFPIIVLVPIIGGAVMAGIAFVSGKALNRERTALEHISTQVGEIVDNLEDSEKEDGL
jgi:hypothetical protein